MATRIELTPNQRERLDEELLSACDRGDQAAVSALLAQGADPGAALPGGTTALMLACWTGSARCSRLLARAGADVDARCSDGATALAKAADGGHVKCVELLLRLGADASACGPRRETPLIIAARRGRCDCVQALLSASDPLARDAEGFTALGIAVANGRVQCVERLVGSEGLGRGPEAELRAQELAEVARGNRQEEVARMLLDACERGRAAWEAEQIGQSMGPPRPDPPRARSRAL